MRYTRCTDEDKHERCAAQLHASTYAYYVYSYNRHDQQNMYRRAVRTATIVRIWTSLQIYTWAKATRHNLRGRTAASTETRWGVKKYTNMLGRLTLSSGDLAVRPARGTASKQCGEQTRHRKSPEDQDQGPRTLRALQQLPPWTLWFLSQSAHISPRIFVSSTLSPPSVSGASLHQASTQAEQAPTLQRRNQNGIFQSPWAEVHRATACPGVPTPATNEYETYRSSFSWSFQFSGLLHEVKLSPSKRACSSLLVAGVTGVRENFSGCLRRG